MAKRLLDKGARFIGQGITGFEGSRSLPKMLEFGTQIVAGVTPGKGGQVLEGVPIFNTVKEALAQVGQVDGSIQFAPPLRVLGAVQEALEAGIKWILTGAEKVPTKDEAIINSLVKQHEAVLIGPNTAGMINVAKELKLGFLAVADTNKAFTEGEIAVLSKSGSMTAETSLHLKNNGLGVSWAVCVGGDIIPGTTFGDLLLELEADPQTKASVIFGELGGTYEEQVAELVKSGKISKPVVAFIAGDFTLQLPKQVQFGHAGAIIEGERGKPDHKRQVLRDAGVKVAENFDDIADLVAQAIK
ncbi:hypothetical protein A2631_05560 [Candidatus Daviesbacteria bacterium RIFCSPHIGHO2_01_FULL_44_29]|uniref:CoA-binding domain-containing protein n=1 Tax=Candidatus Daviesbacteria bacterium RIFCSPHIGHO2_02_FULL_43_12 TaxID=1797776 RepID=A0A1F5KII2_9BACT|nr:MAG: hypothetical protein A2631_05560 [Candidatus Daviesbacteria bacterium RIFCSPHIGHO2_01_FULL_44_29]OGE39225.1 MAG: hypothetical protein A3E86_01305 [Candidatus Daviesbacteria bacterium RIFCSPHIGHO2_12_FULL_47_45]OGE40615.1 MAG: hypothetical protein A3D25_00505 [Candidatus Daviesbacteria bacterium RIFCSPHIGHO2_02_FULL_43_12]OGE70455.1 MAG: hypothetical protein A3B55_00275 [Candidatus Daviesbacteria bacterium RIFCSPLOWO2_01_FULL_43_15]